jgi:hypothetical protein
MVFYVNLYICRRAAFLSSAIYTGYIPYKISSAPPALPYRTSSCACFGLLCFFPSQVSQMLPFSLKHLLQTSRWTSRREFLPLPLRGHSRNATLISHLIFSFRARKFFPLTTHRRPPSTASSTPFHRSACRTRGAPRFRRPAQCASRRKASTGHTSQPSIVLTRPKKAFHLVFSRLLTLKSDRSGQQ